MARDNVEHQQAMLGLRLMTAVQRQGISVYELAKRAQLPVSTVQKICAGAGKQPSFWTLVALAQVLGLDRKSTRLNSSHGYISYAVFCLKQKNKRAQHVT